jgi:hypothetical protein
MKREEYYCAFCDTDYHTEEEAAACEERCGARRAELEANPPLCPLCDMPAHLDEDCGGTIWEHDCPCGPDWTRGDDVWKAADGDYERVCRHQGVEIIPFEYEGVL